VIDYTRLRKKLIPEPDGEPHIVMRTGTISQVNANGTVDLQMSDGTIVPGVSRLVGAYTPVGAVVQVLSFRGSLLVIGGSATNSSQVLPMQAGTHNVTMGASATTFSSAVVFPEAYPGGVTPHVRLNHSDGNSQAQLWIIHATAITNTGFTILGSRTAANQLSASEIDWNSFVP
jgi:hypothetical protein